MTEMNDALFKARKLAEDSQFDEAIALLRAHGDDANAAMQLAVWYLTGQFFTRDIPTGMRYLRKAVEIGHVDAALMEIALIANGATQPGDWPLALQLLKKAAQNDHVAEEQLGMLGEMNLDANGYPTYLPKPISLSQTPEIRYFPAFVSEREARHIADVAHDILEPSLIIDPANGARRRHPIRVSDSAAIGPAREDLVIGAINRRIAAISDTDPFSAEPLTVLRYKAGQQYRLHHDCLPPFTKNQRTKTLIIYLNDSYKGGQTEFPKANIKFTPRAGEAIMFENIRDDGTIVEETVHSGLPVISGSKWIATRWIRKYPYNAWSDTEGELFPDT